MSNIHQLLKIPSEVLKFHSGPQEGEVSRVRPPEIGQKGDVIFVSKKEQLEQAVAVDAKVIIASAKLESEVKGFANSNIAFFLTPSVPMAMTFVLPLFDKKQLLSSDTQIHPTASIHPSAKIGVRVRLGPYAVIEEGAQINDDAILAAHTYVGPFAKVGAFSRLHSFVSLGSFCEIGARCEVMSNTTIGSDGFGFSTTPSGEHRKIPQIGNVIIADEVEIGSNVSIDRAALTSTRIGRGTKIDNHCHIAHNVEIGEGNLIAAGFFTAGSTKTGKHVYTAGGVHLTDHISITDKVTLMGRTGVINDINESGVYAGFPAINYKDSLKSMSVIPHLPKMKKQILKILKHLNLESED